MPSATIRLIVDPNTGKKNVVISYASDEDALPMEHEHEHKALVDKLIEGGALSAADLGQVVVEREEEEAVATATSSSEELQQDEARARREGEG